MQEEVRACAAAEPFAELLTVFGQESYDPTADESRPDLALYGGWRSGARTEAS